MGSSLAELKLNFIFFCLWLSLYQKREQKKKSDWECRGRFWVWIGRRAREEIGKQRGGSTFSNLNKESRLGEFLMHVLFWVVWKLCSESCLNCEISQILIWIAFLEIFQKPPGGVWTAAKRHMQFYLFWVFSMNCLAAEDEPPGGISTVTLFFGCFGVLDVSVMCHDNLYAWIWILCCECLQMIMIY